jgi:threonine dehydrogenase-like Zn-dependent dehydrogenase
MTPFHRSAVLASPGAVRVDAVRTPEPSPNEVRVRLEGCGVCGSNLAVWEGRPWFSYPLEAGSPGHEAWGVIEAAGAEVDGFRSGDRVAVLSHHAFAEVDLADSRHVIAIPDKLESTPFPGEALGCAMNVLARSDIRHGQWVAIIGIGFLGALLVRLAANAGAKVLAISRRDTSLETARRMGATEVIRLDDHHRIIDDVRALTSGAFCERVIEATGYQWPLDLAAELCAERAKLVIAGYHQDGPRQVNMQLWNWRGLDVINAHERDPLAYVAGMRSAIEAVASGALDPSPLYTHRFRLDELPDALNLLRNRDEPFVKALVTYD